MELELVNPEPTPKDIGRRHSSVTTDSWRTSGHNESELLADSCKLMAARTVESLTNEMVSSIIGEVTQRRGSAEKLTHPDAETKVQGENGENSGNKDTVAVRVANHKLLECEVICLQLAFLQLAALKTLATLLSCGRFAELLLVPNAILQKPPEFEKDKVHGKQERSTVQIKITRQPWRSGTCGNCTALHDSVAGPRSPHNCSTSTTTHAPSPSSLSRLVRRISPLIPPSTLPLSAALCSFSEFSSPQLTSPSLSNKPTPQSAPLLRVHRLRTPSPPPPPIAAPLMEMGFSLKHVQKAMNSTGSTGDMSAHTINQLATWMIEHPCIDSDVLEGREDDSGRSSGSEILLSRAQTVDVSQCSPELDVGGISRRSGHGPRRRACSDIRNYLVERAAQDRERQHVRGEAQPLYVLPQDTETADASPHGTDSVHLVDLGSTSGVFPTAASQMDYGLPLICGICHQVSSHLAGHMLSAHPGCGLLWGSGYCGNILGTNYLMCNECQDKYSLQFQCFPKIPDSRSANQSGLGGSVSMGNVSSTVLPSNLAQLLAPDLMGSNSVHDEEFDMLCMQTEGQSSPPSENFSKLAPYLGLGERRTAPEPLLLKEPDPLGASTVPSVTLEATSSQSDDSEEKMASSPLSDSPGISPLQLPDALAACVLSTRLASSHRQWASQQLGAVSNIKWDPRDEEDGKLSATNNTVWSLKADEQVMSWSTQQPHDWQIGGKCHAYLWGSGRHGQLGEAGRSSLVPVETESFSGAQQIVCGQNCTFVIQANGTVLACGEGSYGRLGQGNSDDLHSLSIISSLQGMYRLGLPGI
ncbi:hypothetical protein C0J52_06695 [Blattella germanica]|nr:hypothetical protein C0J52_06695 [Blattella germanica]